MVQPRDPWDDPFGEGAGGEPEGPDNILGEILRIGGQRWQVGFISFRDPMGGPGGQRVLGLTNMTTGEKVPVQAGDYVTEDRRALVVNATGNILSSRNISQSEWNQMNTTPTTAVRQETIGGVIYSYDQDGTIIDIRNAPIGPVGPAPPTAAETALQEAQTRASNANAKLLEMEAAGTTPMSEFQKEQLRLDALRAENDVKELLFSQIGATTRTVFQAQEAERGRQQELAGVDPIRTLGSLRGKAVGTTPTDVFKMQGAEFAGRELPTFSMQDDVATLEAGLRGLEKMAIGGAPQGLFPGLKHGGVIDMKNDNGAFTMRKTARFVGEEGPEIMITDPANDEVEIIPLSRGAQDGGAFSFSGLDIGPLEDIARRLRAGRGIGGSVLRGTRSTGGVLGAQQASTLGARQRGLGSLVRQRGTSGVFIVTPQGLRQISTPEALTALGGGVANPAEELSAPSFARLQSGIGTGAGINLAEAQRFHIPGELGAEAAPLSTRRAMLDFARVNPELSEFDAASIANAIGFLPSVRKIARDYSLLPFDEQEGVKLLYSLAGIDNFSFDKRMEEAQPTGRFTRPQRIGFTGARF